MVHGRSAQRSLLPSAAIAHNGSETSQDVEPAARETQAMPTPTQPPWPPLPLAEWKETYATLHMWLKVVGKIRLVQTPLINHWWNTTFYVTPRGLTTSAIPYDTRTFQIDFDFLTHRL